ncbi:MAG: carboxypeptidase regulatory-like domain-containing protein, partial [Muribaculaceae bacterium]|nr:carboxypeptidase regulatory-like domain-containing protein [Muribaculaceae bacterium]
MKRQVLSLLWCLITTNVIWGQFSVKCVVKDSIGEGEPYASVRIYRAADIAHVSHTGVTDIDGNYNQALAAAGDYVMKITAVGKSELSKNFSVSAANPVADLGTLTLKDAGIELAGVTVTAQRALVKNEIDRLSYDVQADDDSKTNTVLEMLRKVPLVTVDGEDNIKVKGNSNFKIYKN